MLSVQTQSNLLSMSYVDLDDHLDKIVGNSGKEKESVNIRIALSQYPELKGYKHYTGEVLLASSEINLYCDDVLIQRYGNEFVALPFTDDKGVRLHSDPIMFYLGLQNDNGFGIIPFTGWEEHLEKAGIDFLVIRKVRKFLLSHCPANYL